MIAASNGYLLAFDNLSGLPAWLSDALCRLASGGSFAVRQLQAARPLILNGIEEVITRPDLADRSIFVPLKKQRFSCERLWPVSDEVYAAQASR
jgi:hypothetical protein